MNRTDPTGLMADDLEAKKPTPREDPRKTRARWEKATGQTWPKDPKTGRNQDVSHGVPISEGGSNEPDNVEPKPHDEHVDEHKAKGDFTRWGAKGGKKKSEGDGQPAPPQPAKPDASAYVRGGIVIIGGGGAIACAILEPCGAAVGTALGIGAVLGAATQ